MNPVLIAQMINGALSVLMQFRGIVGDINQRLADADNGQFVTVDEVRQALQAAQDEIDRGREMD